MAPFTSASDSVIRIRFRIIKVQAFTDPFASSGHQELRARNPNEVSLPNPLPTPQVAHLPVSSMVYQLSSERQYVDEQAAAQYAANTGDEIVMKQLFNATAVDALDTWVQHIWLTGSGAQEVTPGVGRGYVNHTRLIPQLQIKEQILSAGLPSDDNDKLAVPTILYKVRDAGLFPIVDHIALVRFIEDHSVETPKTEIVWTIKLTLGTEGNAVFASPAMIPPFLQKAVSGALAALATTVDESKQQTP